MYDPKEGTKKDHEFLSANADITMSVAKAREFLDGNHSDLFDYELDIAQGEVFSGKSEEVYVIIKITT